MSGYWRELLVFLGQAAVISLSGAMAPGPVSATALATGTRSRHAGAQMALGHGVVEVPLIVLIVLGAGVLLEKPGVRVGIGFAGGIMLAAMGARMLLATRGCAGGAAQGRDCLPFFAGAALSVSNPYFFIWWATVGLALATRAKGLGIFAFVLFAAVHWLCDLVWLESLSMASFKGSRLLGGRLERVILAVCGAALLLFGAVFVRDATREALRGLTTGAPPAVESPSAGPHAGPAVSPGLTSVMARSPVAGGSEAVARASRGDP